MFIFKQNKNFLRHSKILFIDILFCQTPDLVSLLGLDFVLYKSYKSQQQQEPHQNLLKDLEMDVWQGVSYSEG